jgi:hypothetical protein
MSPQAQQARQAAKKKPVACGCGSVVGGGNLAKHLNTLKHKKWVAGKSEPIISGKGKKRKAPGGGSKDRRGVEGKLGKRKKADGAQQAQPSPSPSLFSAEAMKNSAFGSSMQHISFSGGGGGEPSGRGSPQFAIMDRDGEEDADFKNRLMYTPPIAMSMSSQHSLSSSSACASTPSQHSDPGSGPLSRLAMSNPVYHLLKSLFTNDDDPQNIRDACRKLKLVVLCRHQLDTSVLRPLLDRMLHHTTDVRVSLEIFKTLKQIQAVYPDFYQAQAGDWAIFRGLLGELRAKLEDALAFDNSAKLMLLKCTLFIQYFVSNVLANFSSCETKLLPIEQFMLFQMIRQADPSTGANTKDRDAERERVHEALVGVMAELTCIIGVTEHRLELDKAAPPTHAHTHTNNGDEEEKDLRLALDEDVQLAEVRTTILVMEKVVARMLQTMSGHTPTPRQVLDHYQHAPSPTKPPSSSSNSSRA